MPTPCHMSTTGEDQTKTSIDRSVFTFLGHAPSAGEVTAGVIFVAAIGRFREPPRVLAAIISSANHLWARLDRAPLVHALPLGSATLSPTEL